MVLTNGYYSVPPKPFHDAVSGYEFKGYMHFGYWFLGDGVVIRCSKSSQNVIEDFSKEEFNLSKPGEYSISENKLEVIFDKGLKWEYREVFDILSNNEFENEIRSFKFVEWK